MEAARSLLPEATTRVAYSMRWAASCAWTTHDRAHPHAFVSLEELDWTATLDNETPLAFAKQRASEPGAIGIPGLHHSALYDRSKMSTAFTVDWYQAGHDYELTVFDHSTSPESKPSHKTIATQARSIAAGLSR